MSDQKMVEAFGVWGNVIILKLHAFPNLPNSFPSHYLSTLGLKGNPSSAYIWRHEKNSTLFAQGSPQLIPPTLASSTIAVFRTKARRASASRRVSRNIVTRSRQKSPEYDPKETRLAPIAVSGHPIQLWHVLGNGSLGWRASCAYCFHLSIFLPRASSPGVLMSMLLACWYETW